MNTEYITAFRASPLFFFVSNEIPYAEFSDVLEIADHAHAILGSIPLIQMAQSGAREAVTTEAVFDFGGHHLLTVLNTAHRAGLRFETAVTSAAWACLPVSHVCATEATVHSAWCDEHHGNGICLYRSFLCHIYLLHRPLGLPRNRGSTGSLPVSN